MRKAFLAFCLAAFASLLALGGGGMMCGARTGAWAKSGGRPIPAYGGLCFTAEEANSSVQMTKVGSAPAVSLMKSFDGVNWSDYVVGDVVELHDTGDFVYLAAGEGGNSTLGSSTRAYNKFVMTGLVSASGDITSLRRFDLAQTPLTNNCYNYLFKDCVSLTTAPELTSAEPVGSCYRSMFSGCSRLSSLKVHFTEFSSSSISTFEWVRGVSATGTFYKPSALPEVYGDNYIPNGWTVVNIY